MKLCLSLIGNCPLKVFGYCPLKILNILLGSLTNDLARLIITSTNPEMRRNIEVKALMHYYETFKQLIEENGHKIEYEFEEVKFF